jgi:feruloyl-CoA synthase
LIVSTTDFAPIALQSTVPLGFVPRRVIDDLIRWATERPEQPFLAERTPAGRWDTLAYGDARERIRSTAAALLAYGGSSDAPIAIVADNSIANAVIAHAAMYAGIPYSPISVAYARGDAPPAKLRGLLDVLAPKLAFAGDEAIGGRLRAADASLHVITTADVAAVDPARADAAFADVTPDTVAKILFTSGSTGTPKGVITTNRMLTSNQTMYAQAWPDVVPTPTLVDWLPWSHCFGGSHNVGIVLRNGGTLYIDAGKPVPGAMNTTLENLRDVAPTSYYNVPRGFALLCDALESDEALAQTFFSRLRLLCNAGAALPAVLRDRLVALTRRYAAHDVNIVSSWGTTETAPLATGCWGSPLPDHDSIGVPMPGVAIRLAPVGDRYEIRVKGPNVTPGYWRNPAATSAAFDEDGFYRTGDAGALRDAADPKRGIDFAGRIAENFKLSSGTWVNVGALRLALIDAASPVIEDVIVGGHDTDEIVALFFIAVAPAQKIAGLPNADCAELSRDAAVIAYVREALAKHNAGASSSTRVARALLLATGPNRDAGEITDKGSINQQRALALRAAEVKTLLDRTPSAGIIEP